MKLLMENWRKFLKEEKGSDPQQQRTLKNLLNKKYSSFVDGLEKQVKDPKFANFLSMGLEPDDGDGRDDIIAVRKTAIPVKKLLPTQSQIGLADSLGWISENKPQAAGEYAKLTGGSAADVGGRIITANGKHIVDGHHRWSQVYLLNPEASIPSYDFTVSDSMPAEDRGKAALKLAHLAIAAVDKAVPLVAADAATDIYATQGDENKIKQILNKTISDEMVKSLSDAYGVSSRDEVVNKVTDNALSLYKGTKAAAAKGPERGEMPQTAGTPAFGDTDPLDKMKAMRAGSVNWKTPSGE